MIGIYCYQDTQNDNEIVYIGKDSNIDRNIRYNAHKKPSQYNCQQINRVIQNNPNRYKYKILKKKLSEQKKGKNNHQYKDYYRINKAGKRRNKQQYSIYKEGKVIKTSVHIDKLLKWFKENYPDEEIKELNT